MNSGRERSWGQKGNTIYKQKRPTRFCFSNYFNIRKKKRNKKKEDVPNSPAQYG